MSAGADLWIELVNPDGGSNSPVRQLRHRVPFTHNSAQTPRELALEYLDQFGSHYGVSQSDIAHLNGTVGQPEGQAGGNRLLRWRTDTNLRGSPPETTVVTLQQVNEVRRGGGGGTTDPVDIWAAGIRIVVQKGRRPNGATILCVTSSSSSLLPSPAPGERRDPGAAPAGTYVLRPARHRRKHVGGGKHNPAPGGDIDLVVTREVASAPVPGGAVLRRRFRADTGTVEEQSFVTYCTQCVLPWRLANSSGQCRPQPASTNAALSAHRESAALQLGPAAEPFRGQYVHITAPDGSAIPLPSSLSAEPRTETFALVNAYHHCDTAFRLLHSFGLESPTFDGLLPVRVFHRGPILPNAPDGQVVNAQVVAVPGPAAERPKPEIRFALGDWVDPVHNPLGVASDLRWVWHEFCHALLVAATGELELPFAHSAGDALAAILAHPDAAAACTPEGVTFPWVGGPLRRHDRKVTEGWGWFGTLYERTSYPELHDPFGYVSEQILSSTLFRIYLAVGGDNAADLAVRKDAADYVTYLIMRAIASLGRAETTPCLTPSVFASALMDADIGTDSFTSQAGNARVGGALHKVIRWAFQQQGLYHLRDHPKNVPGPQEPVDVFVGAGGQGYTYTETRTMRRDAITFSPAPAGGRLTVGTQYQISVMVGSQGTEAPPQGVDTVVQVFHRTGPQIGVWDQNWILLGTQSLKIKVGAPQFVRGFPITPAGTSNHAFLVRVFAAGDRSNLFDQRKSWPNADNPEVYLSCSATAPIGQVVPFDNNLAYGVWAAA